MGSQNNYPYRKFLLGSIPREQSDNNSIITVKYNPNMTLMPSKFQSSDGTSSFSQGRNIFLNLENTNIPTNNFALKQVFLKDKSKNCKCETNCENSVCQCSDCNLRSKSNSCSVGKFIPVQSGDQHIQRLKNRAIGRGTLAKKQGDNHVASFSGTNAKNSINYQNTQQALRRLRNRGYVVPPKVVANRNAAGNCNTNINYTNIYLKPPSNFYTTSLKTNDIFKDKIYSSEMNPDNWEYKLQEKESSYKSILSLQKSGYGNFSIFYFLQPLESSESSELTENYIELIGDLRETLINKIMKIKKDTFIHRHSIYFKPMPGHPYHFIIIYDTNRNYLFLDDGGNLFLNERKLNINIYEYICSTYGC